MNTAQKFAEKFFQAPPKVQVITIQIIQMMSDQREDDTAETIESMIQDYLDLSTVQKLSAAMEILDNADFATLDAVDTDFNGPFTIEETVDHIETMALSKALIETCKGRPPGELSLEDLSEKFEEVFGAVDGTTDWQSTKVDNLTTEDKELTAAQIIGILEFALTMNLRISSEAEGGKAFYAGSVFDIDDNPVSLAHIESSNDGSWLSHQYPLVGLLIQSINKVCGFDADVWSSTKLNRVVNRLMYAGNFDGNRTAFQEWVDNAEWWEVEDLMRKALAIERGRL